MNTCSTCRHWKRDKKSDDGLCENLEVIGLVWTPHQQDEMYFKATFGCIFHATDKQRQPSGNSTKLQAQEGAASHGFPPTNEEEIKAFKIWLLDPKRKKQSDELAYLKESSDGYPKGWILERFRRHKEQQTKAGK